MNINIYTLNAINIKDKYKEIITLIDGDYKSFIMTPSYYFNKFRKNLQEHRLYDLFIGTNEESVNNSRYSITIFIRDNITKKYIREEIYINDKYEKINASIKRG